MKITKANLKKGQYLYIEFQDGSSEDTKSWPHVEASPPLIKAFLGLNSHLCELTEQYSSDGNYDYDMTVCRGYTLNKKDQAGLTGLRTLSNGVALTLNANNIGLDQESSYPKSGILVQKLDKCREEIITFMKNNRSQEEIQGKLFDKNNTFIVKSAATAEDEENDLPPETRAAIAAKIKELEEAEAGLTEQDIMDLEEPVTQEHQQVANAKKNRSKK